MAKQRIGADYLLTEGDIVDYHFKSTGLTYIKATQIYLIEKKLEGREDFRIKTIYCPEDEPSNLVVTVQVLKSNPILVYAGYIALTIIGVGAIGVIFNLTLRDIFLNISEVAKAGIETVKEVVTSEEGKIALAGMGITLPLIAGIVLFKVLK